MNTTTIKPTIARILLLATAVSFSTPVFAEDSKPVIAVVDIQRLMKESTAAKSVSEQMESKGKGFQSAFSKKEESINKEKQELGKQQSVMAKDEFEKKARAFQAKVTDLQKEAQAKKAVLNSAFERSLNDIQKAITEIIEAMATEKGFMVAIPSSQLLYANNGLDISSEVLERLNKKLPKLDVKFDEPAKDDKKSEKK